MDPNTLRLMQGSAGAAGGKLYVEDVFQTWLYTGNGSTQTITNGVNLAGKGGLVWIKNRTQGTVGAASHVLHDSARGVTKYLSSNLTSQEFDATTGGVTAFNATGFDLGSLTRYNNFGDNYTSWTFRKQAKFFDVVTWTGDNSLTRQVPHNLGTTPAFIIIKRTDTSADWIVAALNSSNNTYLNLRLNTSAASTGGFGQYPSGSAYMSSTELGVGWWAMAALATLAEVNATGGTYVAYLFAHDAGGFGASGSDSIIKCGTYTGTSSSVTVDLGWEPQWVLIKRSDATGNWIIHDNMRGIVTGGNDPYLVADSAGPDDNNVDVIELTPTGFRIPSASYSAWNTSGGTYIYIAIRRGPMKTPTDATKVFSTIASESAGSFTTVGFVPDLRVMARKDGVGTTWPLWTSRFQGQFYLRSSNANAEADSGANYFNWDAPTNQTAQGFLGGSPVSWLFGRAPGFFDVVAYTGTGPNQQVTHNLGVVPEMMIIKNRSAGFGWEVYHSGMGTDLIELQSNSFGSSANAGWWDNGAPTSTVIKTPSSNNAGANRAPDKFVAYLFATCPGVSKVGNYTGTGTTKQIDCGFANGASFVLIRRTDSGGDWYVWDSARGIVAGNDPYLLLNSTAAEVTNTDYVDTYSAGFEISSTAPAAINANGGSFIFLAVA